MINTVSIILTRVLGAYCIFSGLSLAATYVTAWRQYNGMGIDVGILLFFSVTVVVLIGVGAMLWISPMPFARRLSAGAVEEEPPVLVADDIVAASCFLIGLYWVVVNLGQTLSTTWRAIQLARQASIYDRQSISASASEVVLEMLVQGWMPILLGILMMVGTNTIVKLFRRIRRF